MRCPGHWTRTVLLPAAQEPWQGLLKRATVVHCYEIGVATPGGPSLSAALIGLEVKAFEQNRIKFFPQRGGFEFLVAGLT